MGGRGAYSASGRTTQAVMSEDEFLAIKGLGSTMSDYMLDKTRLPHGETARQRKQRYKEAERAMNEHTKLRDEARAEYRRLLESGKVRPPTRIEEMMRTARGFEENESVQAARRALKKRGINWRTGEKL